MAEYEVFLNGYIIVEANSEEEAVAKVQRKKLAIEWEVSEVERND